MDDRRHGATDTPPPDKPTVVPARERAGEVDGEAFKQAISLTRGPIC